MTKKETTTLTLEVSLINHGNDVFSLFLYDPDDARGDLFALDTPRQARKFITKFHPKDKTQHEVLR